MRIENSPVLFQHEKQMITANLSRGAVHQKWGALPVAIWLALEANGDEQKLFKWIQLGPEAVTILAKKYLPQEVTLLNKQQIRRE